jgi:hypothetical protein
MMKIWRHYICRAMGPPAGAAALSGSGQSLPKGGQ